MRQSQGLGVLFIEPQGGGHGARHLRDLDGVSEPIAEVVAKALGEDLRLAFEPAKSAGMNDAVTVALESVAVRVRSFGKFAPAHMLCIEPESRQHRGKDYLFN